LKYLHNQIPYVSIIGLVLKTKLALTAPSPLKRLPHPHPPDRTIYTSPAPFLPSWHLFTFEFHVLFIFLHLDPFVPFLSIPFLLPFSHTYTTFYFPLNNYIASPVPIYVHTSVVEPKLFVSAPAPTFKKFWLRLPLQLRH
jgi:hypothetical protein